MLERIQTAVDFFIDFINNDFDFMSFDLGAEGHADARPKTGQGLHLFA